MAESSSELEPWRLLYETFDVEGDDRQSVARPTTKELDRFEKKTGIKLPAGYRAYLQVFGPGVLIIGSDPQETFIRSPYCKNRAYELVKAVERIENLKNDPPRGMDDQTRRLVVFSWNGLGDEFGFDPQDITDSEAPEFGVYAWYRGDNVVKMSDTFQGFIKMALDPKARSEHRSKQAYKRDDHESQWASADLKQKRAFRRPRPLP